MPARRAGITAGHAVSAPALCRGSRHFTDFSGQWQFLDIFIHFLKCLRRRDYFQIFLLFASFLLSSFLDG